MTKVLQKKDKGLGFLRHWKVMTMTLLLLTFSIGQMWGADFTITLDQFRTDPVTGIVKVPKGDLSLSGGTLQLSSGNKDFQVMTTNSDYKIKQIVFETTKAVISYGGEAISENTFTPENPATSFTLNLAASGGTAKISKMTITLTTATSETLEELIATAISDGVYTTGSSVITLSTEGGEYSSGKGVKLSKSKNTRSLTVATSTSYKLKFVTLYYYDAIFSRSITASTGSYTASTYTWTPGSTSTNTVTLTFATENTENTTIRGIYVGYESASSCSEPAAPTISSEGDKTLFTEGETITLTASHDGSNHSATTTYTWYKGGTWDAAKVTTPVQAAATGSSGYTFTKANCVTGDAGIYWCEAANSTCKSHNATGFEISVSAAAGVCPSGMSISGTAAYTEGQTITLNAALSAGNGDITYTWYKGADLATAKTAGSIGTGTSYTKANCVAGDAGNYFCVATKDACSDAESTAYAVTVEEKTCPTSGVVFSVSGWKNVTNGSAWKGQDQIDVEIEGLTISGGSAHAVSVEASKTCATDGSGDAMTYYMNYNSVALRCVLDCPLEEGDLITIEGNSSSTQNVYILTNTNSRSTSVTSTNTSGTKKYYTVVKDDILEGRSDIYIWRAGSSANKYIKTITITRPYAITFSSAKGSAPSATTGFEVALTQITGVSGWIHTGWTANKVVKVGGSDVAIGTAMAVDATATLSDDTQFMAVWEEEVPTFSVTYKANNGTEEADVEHATESAFAANMFTAPEGKLFNGWNTKAEGDGTPYAVGDAVTVATTVFAQWVVDPTIRLIKKVGEEYVLNTTDFEFNSAKTTLQTADYTVEDVVYPKNVKLGGTATAVTGINADKYIAYHTKTNSTHVEIALYDAYSSNTTHNVYIARVKEGNGTPEIETVAIVTGTKRDYYKSYDLTGRTSLYIYVGNDNARVCQVFVTENGEPNVADAPAEGYSINLDKGRMFAASGVAKSFEGLTYVVAEDYQPTNRTALKIKTQNTHYISFEIPTGQTRQLQLTASGSYNVSKTLGDESAYVSGNQNINLTEGVWYINPNGSNVNITNIVFAAAPAQKTVTFKDGASTLDTKYVWSGETVSALSPAPTKSGYRFVKWQLSGADYDFATPVTDNIVLDAVWQEVVVVTFDPNNGEDTFTKTADKGAKIAAGDIPADPTYAGYDFQGWTLDITANPIVHVDLSTQTFSAATTLKAHWEVAQDDATLSALSYNGNAIDVNSAEDVSGVQTYTVHLPWGSSINAALISVTKNAESASLSSIVYNSENKQATFQVESGNHSVVVNYAIQFVIDPKRGTSIIKATTNNVVTGLIGGTIDQSYSGNANSRKLNKGNYFGVTLANDETFQEGDVFIVNITTAADLGKFMVFADKDRTELIADQGIVYTKPDVASPVVCPTGEMMLVLPAAANGKKSLYLSRENVDNSEQWNVTFSYIEVTREMAPAIKSFKFGDDAATINESAKTITYEVAYGTAVTALTPTVEAYGNNGATYTPAGATDFTSPVVYTVTDAYNELHTDYTVTVNIAAPSTNAYLASLSVAGYALDFDKEEETYNIVLDYGTTVLPTITYEVEEAGLAEAVKVENGVNGATTITVTPQAGAGYEKVYTINFSVSTNPKYVIYDGSTMTNIASATGADGSTGFSYSLASNIPLSGDAISSSWGGKDYTYVIKGFKPTDNTNNIVSFVVPEGYVAKVRLVGTTNSTGTERQMFIAMNPSKNVADAISDYIITSSTYDAQGFITDYLLPNTYYLGSTDSYRLYEFSVTLYPIDYSRTMTAGRFGTICLPNGGVMIGAALFEVAYYGQTSEKIFFDEIVNGVMEAGVPYIFLPREGATQLGVYYTDAVNATAGNHNGLYGSYSRTELPSDGSCYILLNNQYCQVLSAENYVGANKAYLKLDDITPVEPALVPGRRRMSMSVVRQTPTGLENGELLNGENGVQKVLINGELFILRGEKMYDATGRLVK